ncbi:hypothetical protein A3K63_04390 [Candidatus Micrarchaeota archaeon RBG_16_49_10]|nr:MAG: hypothetical protein A3K63_04390 [Candidatus Micrarchaeota archaeon RBG_16_49_10]
MLLEIILYSGLAGLATIAGIVSVLYKKELVKKYSKYMVAIAAGILMGASFFDLIPEAMALNQNALMVVLAGIVIFYFLENMVVIHICEEEDCGGHRFGIMTIMGLGVHSLIDGVAIGAGFGISSALGLVTTLAVISHEIPEGIITSSLLFASKFERRKGIMYSLGVALATPVGAVATALLLGSVSESFLGGLVALAAGSFIYISAADLIPETHKKSYSKTSLFVLLGVLLSYFISSIFG